MGGTEKEEERGKGCKHRVYGGIIVDVEKKKSQLTEVSTYFMLDGKTKEK